MQTQLTIDFRSDNEIKAFLNEKIEVLKGWARGDGFNAIQARMKLKAIEKLSEAEKIQIGRQMFELGIE